MHVCTIPRTWLGKPQKTIFFLVAMPLPLPPLSGRATKKKNFIFLRLPLASTGADQPVQPTLHVVCSPWCIHNKVHVITLHPKGFFAYTYIIFTKYAYLELKAYLLGDSRAF